MINVFLKEQSEENKFLFELFLSYIFDSRILEHIYSKDIKSDNIFRQIIDESYMHVSNELSEKMWDKVDLQEFTEMILSQNYLIYSIDNWSRNNDSDL